MYFYINIRSDSKYSVFESVLKIQGVLNKHQELEADGENRYKNSNIFPWVSVGIFNCDSKGNYPAKISQSNTHANLVEFICPNDGSDENEQRYVTLAISIAKELNWEAVNDQSGKVYSPIF